MESEIELKFEPLGDQEAELWKDTIKISVISSEMSGMKTRLTLQEKITLEKPTLSLLP